MESITYLKNLRIPPKKLRFYLEEVKKMTPADALRRLYYGKQRSTQILYKAVKSAVANATLTLKTTSDLLKFKLLTVEEGQTLKRYLPGSRGNVKPVKKHNSHVKIILVTKETAKPVVKAEEKKETKKVETEAKEAPKKKSELKIKKTATSAKAEK